MSEDERRVAVRRLLGEPLGVLLTIDVIDAALHGRSPRQAAQYIRWNASAP